MRASQLKEITNILLNKKYCGREKAMKKSLFAWVFKFITTTLCVVRFFGTTGRIPLSWEERPRR